MGDEKVNLHSLPDIRSINVDKSLPYEERVLEYVRQMRGNPYHFKCGKFSIKASYNQSSESALSCLYGALMSFQEKPRLKHFTSAQTMTR